MVTNIEPLTVWFYDEFYIRVCGVEYDMSDKENKFVHLTNNCVSKVVENYDNM